MTRTLLLSLCLALAGCGPSPCDRENLPEQGRTETSEQLFRLAQYAARNDCWSELYDHLSKRTRDEHSYLKIRPFITSWRIDEPWEYKVADILAKGAYVESFPGGPNGQELIMISYQEPGRPELLAQLLVVAEQEDGRAVRRLGLQEQYEGKVPINQAPAQNLGNQNPGNQDPGNQNPGDRSGAGGE
ncbi:MAG: hypothetical protein AB7N76_34500 [Planctomycetota bacterium]